jgi:hypothetical protein
LPIANTRSPSPARSSSSVLRPLNIEPQPQSWLPRSEQNVQAARHDVDASMPVQRKEEEQEEELSAPEPGHVDVNVSEGTSRRLNDLGHKAAQIQDELQAAREARTNNNRNTRRTRQSDATEHGHTTPRESTSNTTRRHLGQVSQEASTMDHHSRIVFEPHNNIVEAQLASLRAEQSYLADNIESPGAPHSDRRRSGRSESITSSRQSRSAQSQSSPQIFDPKSPRGASFGATRTARFASQGDSDRHSSSGDGRRSIRKGSPSYDWTFE